MDGAETRANLLLQLAETEAALVKRDEEVIRLQSNAQTCLAGMGQPADGPDPVYALCCLAWFFWSELKRFQAGDLTPDEFQALCHHLDEDSPVGCTPEVFGQGCRDYQRKLFGEQAWRCNRPGHDQPDG